MKHIAFVLILTASGVAFAQATLEVRVKPATEKETKEEAKALDPAMKAKVDAWVAKLRDGDRRIRKQARNELAGLGKPAGHYLKPYLKSDDPEVKLVVEETLKKIAFNDALSRDNAEPNDRRKSALARGAKPETSGEKKWLMTLHSDTRNEKIQAAIAEKNAKMAELEAIQRAKAEAMRAEAMKAEAEKVKAMKAAEEAKWREKMKATPRAKRDAEMRARTAAEVRAMKAAVEAEAKAKEEVRIEKLKAEAMAKMEAEKRARAAAEAEARAKEESARKALK